MANELSANILSGERQVEVFGADPGGRQFCEQTQTLTISGDCATISLANKLPPESELIVRNPATNKETVVRVVEMIQGPGAVHVYSVVFTDPSVNLWQIESPGVQAEKTLIMECSRCHAVDSVVLSESDMKIYESKQALVRYCVCSNSSTSWKQTDRNVTGRRAKEDGVRDQRRRVLSLKEPAMGPQQERRRAKRTAMRTGACIRSLGREVVVECEDVSRSGFRFKSRKAYPAGAQIEAAVPYMKSSANIFVTAQIVYQMRVPGGFYRHGAAYITIPDSKF